LQCTAARLKL